MQRNFFRLVVKLIFTFVFGLACPLLSSQGRVFAQDDPFDYRAPICTAGTVSGTYGYRLTGSLAGIGPVSLIGILTLNSDGTLTGLHKLFNLNGLPIADLPYGGTFKMNSDCSTTGEFIDGTGLKVSFKFVAVDGGDELYVMNTDAGNLLSGVVKRITKAGRAPSCTVGTISGPYGIKLEGSVQGVGPLVEVGVANHSLDGTLGGIITGLDTVSLNGQIIPNRTIDGKFKMSSDCTGTGSYKDNLGQTINYAFVATGGGRELFLHGTDPGVQVSGIAKRVQ